MPRKPIAKRRQGRPNDEPVGRDALVDAARELLRDRPPAGITRLEIARSAGVDPALIRYYFGTKEALLAEAAEQIADEIRQLGRAALADDRPARERLARFVQAYALLQSRNPNYHQLLLEAIVAGGGSRTRRLRREMTEGIAAVLSDLLDDGARAGELRRVDPRMLAVAVLGIAGFFGSGWGVISGLFPRESRQRVAEEYARFAAEFVTAALAADARGVVL